ncbi:carotenoid oxygenase [Acinetobacter sp. NCu2D-2]|uniref:carotenoid oxygenase family protein n=1 Tax=Acinetobacter sp. NCu2D-2 TaxID=1608473 RepID=UPI0007CE00BF|nr:carotenoid oxygenase family protein [Acinetobacter sp. NCu2D-2]ANF82154.1 carotenoid oxygenase [Acinetobacter sp. NCu2D-2]
MQLSTSIQRTVKKVISKTIRQAMGFAHSQLPYSHDNPYLDGVFAPQRLEQFCAHLKVEGEIPQQFSGTLMRIGPNPITVKNPLNYHWFVGDGMIHGLRLDAGQAKWYKSKYVGSDSVQQKLQRAKIDGEARGVTDAVNTNILSYAGKIWALVEAGSYPIEIDQNLESKRQQFFQDQQDFPFTAHPHIDPATGEIHAVCYDALEKNKVFYLHLDTQGKLKHHVEIPVEHGPMIHDCAITQNHVLIFDLCVNFSLKSAINGSLLPYQWNPLHQARIGVLPFGGQADDIVWYDIEPCFIFHSANAFEMENGNIVLDAVVHSSCMVNSIQGPIEDQDIRLERFVFIKDKNLVTRTVLSKEKQEFPRINEAYTGRPYRYIYSVSFGEFDDPHQVKSNRLISHDLELHTTQTYSYGEDFVTGEVIFVARENPEKNGVQAENDGWLMSYVHALDGSPSKVVILNAQNIEAGPVATIHLPTRVPLGFHCNWIDDATLASK